MGYVSASNTPTIVGIGYTYDAVNDVFVAPPAPEPEAEP
jgi:hypothetical protein